MATATDYGFLRRFNEGIARGEAALAMSMLLLMLVVASAFQPGRPHLPTNRYSDILLYRHIVSRVSQGENYYAVAGAEQRAHGYPTSPAPAFREPTEALLTDLRAEARFT